jgi:hypothetical protein
LREPRARDFAGRNFKRHLKLERGWAPSSVNLAQYADFAQLDSPPVSGADGGASHLVMHHESKYPTISRSVSLDDGRASCTYANGPALGCYTPLESVTVFDDALPDGSGPPSPYPPRPACRMGAGRRTSDPCCQDGRYATCRDHGHRRQRSPSRHRRRGLLRPPGSSALSGLVKTSMVAFSARAGARL